MSEATHPITFGITGASGAPYAVGLLSSLIEAGRTVQLIVSDHGWRILGLESGISDIEQLKRAVGGRRWDRLVHVFDDRDRGATPASGSALSAGMIVCPCSMGTLSAISNGASRSLIERAADVTLKERRRLVLVTRETPLSSIHLRNMLRVTLAGGVVMPAAPGFYNQPKEIGELVDFIVARALDQLGVEHTRGRRWKGESR